MLRVAVRMNKGKIWHIFNFLNFIETIESFYEKAIKRDEASFDSVQSDINII